MKQYSYRNFREMEAHVLSFCDEVVLFDNYDEDDLVKCYITGILTYHMQDTIIADCLEHGYDEDLVDLMGEISVDIPDELIDFYRGAVDLDDFDVPEEKKDTYIKMNKHELYKLMIENQSLFEDQENGQSFHSRSEIEKLVNEHLKKKAKANNMRSLKIDLSASTLTAMVLDGVLEREFSAEKRCYAYRLVLPIKEQYKR